jgi:hypothetical protein
MPVLYTSEYFGAAPILSVSTFGDLPATATSGQRISITAESALFDVTSYPAVVRWSGSAWELESCATTYLTLAAVEFASGTWTGTGGTVGTRSKATVVSTTYNESWVWNSSNNIFIPDYLGLTTIQNQKKIKGDSASLDAGWTCTPDAGCTAVSSGGKLVLTATSGGGTHRYAAASFADASQTASTNFYMKCLFKGTNTRTNPGQTSTFFQYKSYTSPTAGRVVEFGSALSSDGTQASINGKFMNRTSNDGTIYTTTANRGDSLATETLIQFRSIGDAALVKVGNGAWHDIAKSSCRSENANLFYIGTHSHNHVGNVAVLELRYLQAIRYT